MGAAAAAAAGSPAQEKPARGISTAAVAASGAEKAKRTPHRSHGKAATLQPLHTPRNLDYAIDLASALKFFARADVDSMNRELLQELLQEAAAPRGRRRCVDRDPPAARRSRSSTTRMTPNRSPPILKGA